MELTLTRLDSRVQVYCDAELSHTFEMAALIPKEGTGDGEGGLEVDDLPAYGRMLYGVLFRTGSPAERALRAERQRIALVAADDDLQAVPWEYMVGPEGPVVLQCPFVRALPEGERIATPELNESLHIVAALSNPLGKKIVPVDVEGAWWRLEQALVGVDQKVILERCRPATIECLSQLVGYGGGRVVHFLGHGTSRNGPGRLLFEREDGGPSDVSPSELAIQVGGGAYLVNLNACESAAPNEQDMSNMALTLVRRGVPYVIGMRLIVGQSDAAAFSRALYGALARGATVEQAILRGRLALKERASDLAYGVPVLYTALGEAGPAFPKVEGKPEGEAHASHVELGGLPAPRGAFQGRVAEQLQLGAWLTQDTPPHLITIHGAGGQGKTALARAVVERYEHAFPGGVWSWSLADLPAPERLVVELARFVGLSTEGEPDPAKLQAAVLGRLGQRRTLLVLDNAETLAEAVEESDEELAARGRALGRFLRDGLNLRQVTLLATCRRWLGWADERQVDLEGLSDEEGARLFRQHASRRQKEIEVQQAEALSQLVGGHPLSLQLLGGAFNEGNDETLAEFVGTYEAALVAAEDAQEETDARHRSLYACIRTSVSRLSPELRDVLSALWVFQAPFMDVMAGVVVGADQGERSEEESGVGQHLRALADRALLERQEETIGEGRMVLYQLLPALRPYVREEMEQAAGPGGLLARFSQACRALARLLHSELDRGSAAAYLARQAYGDLERAADYLDGDERADYLCQWAWVVYRLGDPWRALQHLEQALSLVEGRDQGLVSGIFSVLGLVYRAMGQPEKALGFFEQELAMRREVGDRAREATTLNNLGGVYGGIGQPAKALECFRRALPILRKMGDREGEAATLNNIGGIYDGMGQPAMALGCYEQALPIVREIRDWAAQAVTLNNIGMVYGVMGQPAKALECLLHVLPIRRDVGDRAGEAITLSNMGWIYDGMGQLVRALACYKQALWIHREVGDRAGEAVTLSNMGHIYLQQDEPERSVGMLTEAMQIAADVGAVAQEASYCYNLVVVLNYLGRGEKAAMLLRHSIMLLERAELSQDAAGATLEMHRALLHQVEAGEPETDLGEGGDEVMAAIQAYVGAEDWEVTCQVVEERQADLYRPEVEGIIWDNIIAARKSGDEEWAALLETHLRLLWACKAEGIGAAFARLTQRRE